MDKIIEIELQKISPYPQNKEIYGELEIEDLVVSIQEMGYLKTRPLILNKDFQILSGHRRFEAVKQLGFTSVPCIIQEFEDAAHELQFLLSENVYRTKTNEQKVREGLLWEEIERKKAQLRRNNLPNSEKENLSDQELGEKGSVRDIVAKKCGMGSGINYERAKKVVLQIDIYEQEGQDIKARELRDAFDKSVNGAFQMLPIPLNEQSKVSDPDIWRYTGETQDWLKENMLVQLVDPLFEGDQQTTLVRRYNGKKEISVKINQLRPTKPCTEGSYRDRLSLAWHSAPIEDGMAIFYIREDLLTDRQRYELSQKRIAILEEKLNSTSNGGSELIFDQIQHEYDFQGTLDDSKIFAKPEIQTDLPLENQETKTEEKQEETTEEEGETIASVARNKCKFLPGERVIDLSDNKSEGTVTEIKIIKIGNPNDPKYLAKLLIWWDHDPNKSYLVDPLLVKKTGQRVKPSDINNNFVNPNGILNLSTDSEVDTWLNMNLEKKDTCRKAIIKLHQAYREALKNA